MKPTQSHPGHYWKTDDEAELWFNESGSEPPQTIRCFNMQDCNHGGEARDVAVDGLEFLAAGVFGQGRLIRPDSTACWTGNCHRFGIYRNPAGMYRNGIVLLERHGGGMFGYAFDTIEAGETWERITASFPPEMVWNICRQIATVYGAARDAERRLVYRAFAEGRLKRRRRHNQVHVEMLNASPLNGSEALRSLLRLRPLLSPVNVAIALHLLKCKGRGIRHGSHS